MKLISGFREKQLKKIKEQWNNNKITLRLKGIDKDKVIDCMREDIDKIFILLEID